MTTNTIEGNYGRNIQTNNLPGQTEEKLETTNFGYFL